MFPSKWENTYHFITKRSLLASRRQCFADAQLGTLI
jgi:hypothetical protein